MLSPAGSVTLYLPKRSTMPARACGTIRTVLTRVTTTKIRSRSATMPTTCMRLAFFRLFSVCGSGSELGDFVDVGGGAADLEHLDLGPDSDHVVVHVRAGAPDLP